MSVTNLKTGESAMQESAEPFSSVRLSIANFSIAEQCARKLIDKVVPRKIFGLRPALVILVQPMISLEGGISQVEELLLQDLCVQLGAKRCVVHHDTNELSRSMAIAVLNER